MCKFDTQVVTGAFVHADAQVPLVQLPTNVSLYYTNATDGHVCGVRTSLGVGCATNEHVYTVDAGYTFAGFISLTASEGPAASDYLLMPLQYS